MFRHERRDKILALLKQKGRVEVDELAAQYGVSPDSIRKDLQHLAKDGKCKRVYGGATLLESEQKPAPVPTPARTTQANDNVASLTGLLPREPLPSYSMGAAVETALADDPAMLGRLAVARRAYMEINPGDSVFLDVSRTNSLLADLIAQGDKPVIVTTNMLDVMRKLANLRHVTVLGTGGYLNVNLDGFVGSATVSMLEPLLFSKAFIGASGVDLERMSVTSNNIDSGSVKERAIHNASYKFLLADADKFGVKGNFRFASIDDFSAIITNASDPDVLASLRRMGVPVLRSEA